jgi:hypothetical protein
MKIIAINRGLFFISEKEFLILKLLSKIDDDGTTQLEFLIKFKNKNRPFAHLDEFFQTN